MNRDDQEILAVARAGFVEEAQEMLVAFEAALLAIETAPDDAEAVNCAFRAAHTIKGTAGLFGFDAVVAFTHVVESVLEAMRAGELAPTDAGIATLLQSRDQIEGLLAELGQAQPSAELAQRGAALAAQLRALQQPVAAGIALAAGATESGPGAVSTADGNATTQAGVHNSAGGGTGDDVAAGGAAVDGGTDIWHVSLRLGSDALRNGLDPMSFIRYLATVGEVKRTVTDTARVPELGALDPESCHLGFDILLATSADAATIEQVFDFLRDDCEIAVLPPAAAPGAYAALLDARCGDDADARAALEAGWSALGLVRRGAADDADDAAHGGGALPGGATSTADAATAPAATTAASPEDITWTTPAASAAPTAVAAHRPAHDAPAVQPPVAASSASTADSTLPAPATATAAPAKPADARAPRERRTDESRFIRVRADKLDALIDLIGELVIASSGAQLAAHAASSTAKAALPAAGSTANAAAHESATPRFTEAALRIHELVEQARDGALGLRMVPVGETFTRFQRVVRDVGKQLGKQVELDISGGDTELDKSMVDTIADPLMHLVRNSLDHGLEAPAERIAAGKSPTGALALNAYHEASGIVIEVSDDGRGLSRDRIFAKAVERGLVPADAVLDDEAIHQLIFSPGFSTAETVTNLSGRGVGMDVVKRNVESLRGQIRVASQPGRGATIQIRLPLTLAIIDGFLTSVGGVSYVLPLEIVSECIEAPSLTLPAEGDALHPPAVAGCFDLRGQVLPYLDLRRCFGHTGPRPPRQSVIVVRTSSTHIGLLVDRLHGEYQTVIKPLRGIFAGLPGLAGSTILGNGEVALILDVPALEARQMRARRHPDPILTTPVAAR